MIRSYRDDWWDRVEVAHEAEKITAADLEAAWAKAIRPFPQQFMRQPRSRFVWVADSWLHNIGREPGTVIVRFDCYFTGVDKRWLKRQRRRLKAKNEVR